MGTEAKTMDIEKRKFEVGNLKDLAIVFGITAVVLSAVLTLLADNQADQTVNTAAYNASTDGIGAVAKFSGKLGFIAGIVILVIVIGLLTRYLMKA